MPLPAVADSRLLDLTGHGAGLAMLLVFAVAYLLVVSEEFTGLRKSKPMILAAGISWMILATAAGDQGRQAMAAGMIRDVLEEYAELLLFLLAAMTYVNAMTERNLFGVLRWRLAASGASYRQLFWITGVLAFFLSALIDNLTTALVMGAVITALGAERRFVAPACINVVVAANAGGAWSAFGDITSLMVWQAGHLSFFQFPLLLGPSLVTWLVPALAMHWAIPRGSPPASDQPDGHRVAVGGTGVVLLFVATLLTAVGVHLLLDLPPFLGMMTGLAYLQFYGYYLRRWSHVAGRGRRTVGDVQGFDVFRYTARAEWDTLLFFYGVVLCVGALGAAGYLLLAAQYSFTALGATTANVLVGLVSAVVDNIPVMAAVLGMDLDMPAGQWLLITLTTGVGGSLLSVGSAAGVALMGQTREYTFFRHLRWTPAIALGYAAGIWAHLVINRGLF
jgi:Na+/H+ antiporter NhaD/arsenite permease-like protein